MVTPVVGADFIVNTTTISGQNYSSIVPLGEGRFLICWQSHIHRDYDDFGDDNDVRGQIFNADGQPAGDEFVISGSSIHAVAPRVALLSNGNFVVSWGQFQGDVYDIYARIFDSDGVPATDPFLANTTTEGFQFWSEITGLQNGGFVIAWSHENGEPRDARARIFDADGVASGPDFSLPATPVPGSKEPSIASLSDGRFVAAWHSWSAGATITARIFEPNGEAASGDIPIAPDAARGGLYPTVAGIGDGRFIVTWQGASNLNATSPDIQAQICNADGSLAGDSFVVNTTVLDGQYRPNVTALDDGGFAVTWSSQEGVDHGVVRARLFNAERMPLGSDFLISSPGPAFSGLSRIVALSDEQLGITWSASTDEPGDSDIRAAIISLNSENDPPQITSNGGGDAVSISIAENTTHVTVVTVTDPDPGQMPSYSIAGGADADLFVIDQSTGALAFAAAPDFEDPADADGNNAYEVIVHVSDGVSGTDTQAILVGVAFDASVIIGTSQADVLIGGPGPNAILGGDDDDKLLGRPGDDDLDGGEGNDFLSGEGGNDLLKGGAGADLMWGAADDDTYFVDNSGDRVVEGPNGGTDTVHSTIGYTLGSYVEDLVLDGGDIDGTGNKFDNRVTGSAGHNTLSGMIGRDRLEGGAGDDTLIGGRDSDTFVFKAGFGHDIITDFAAAGSYSAIGPEHDVLEFDSAVFADAAALFAHSQDTAEGVLIAADTGDTLLIKHTTMMKLQAHPEDFHFV